MPRTLVLALVVCALGVAVAISLSLGRRGERERVVVSSTPAVSSARDTAATSDAAPASDSIEPASTTNESSRATAWPDPKRDAFEILVVREEDESPIAGARVWGERGTPSEDVGARITGADGRARWADMRPRALALEATAPGRTTASVTLTFDPVLTASPFVVRLPAQRDVRVRLVDAQGMDATRASIGINDEQAPSVTLGIAAVCTPVGQRFDSRGAPTSRVVADSWSGLVLAWRLQIRGNEAACVHVLLGDVVLAAMPLDPRSTELAIQVSREDMHRWNSPIVVRVLAASTREPVLGAQVALSLNSSQGTRMATDADGLARFEDLFAGEFGLTVSGAGLALHSMRLRRPIEGEIEVLMKVGHDVDGVVLDPAGAAKSNVVVVAYDAAEMGGTARALQTVTSDVSGRFNFGLLPAEEVVLAASIEAPASETVFLPARKDLPPACQVVPCKGGAHDVVLRWLPTDPEKYARGRAPAGNR